MDNFLELFLSIRPEVKLTIRSARPTGPGQVEDKLAGVLPTNLMEVWTAIHDFGVEVKKSGAVIALLAKGTFGKAHGHFGSDVEALVLKHFADVELLARMGVRFQKAMSKLKEFDAYRVQIKSGALIPRLRVDWKMVVEPKVKPIGGGMQQMGS